MNLLQAIVEILAQRPQAKPLKVQTVHHATVSHHYTGGFVHPLDLMAGHLVRRGEPIYYDGSRIKTCKSFKDGAGHIYGAKTVQVDIRRVVHPPVSVPKQGKREARRRKRQMRAIAAKQAPVALAA